MISAVRNYRTLKHVLGSRSDAVKFMKEIKPLKKGLRNDVVDFVSDLNSEGYSNISAKCSGAERVTVSSSCKSQQMSNDIDFKKGIMCQTTESNVTMLLSQFLMPYRNVIEKIWSDISNGTVKLCKTETKYACEKNGETKMVSTIIDNPVTGNRHERIEQNGVKTYYKYINGQRIRLFTNK